LVEIGADQTTLVLYTADNGYSWGAHCHRPKRCPYDECNRVPLTIRAPFLRVAPRVEPRFGLNIDFAFTFAELAGVVPPIPQDGRSLVRLLKDLEPAWRTDFLYEQWEDTDDDDQDADARRPPTLAQVRGPEWKYTEYTTNEAELYDMVNDPFELRNEIDNPAHAGLREELAARLRQLRPDWSPSGAFLDDLLP
jgi:arylsulfatase A-like enzyme